MHIRFSLALSAAWLILSILPSCGGNNTKYIYVDKSGPMVVGASFLDADNSRSVSAGDVVSVFFNKNVRLNGATVNSFNLPVSGDSISGSAVALGSNPKEVRITLASGAALTINGNYKITNVTAGSPSGIDVANSTVITGQNNVTAEQTIFRGVDIQGYLRPFGPRVASAQYTDANFSGVVDAGDAVAVTFTAVVSTSGGYADDCFTLPVLGDSFGTGASFPPASSALSLTITLGSGVTLNPLGVFDAFNTNPGAPSGLSVSQSIARGAIFSPDNGATVESGTIVDLGGSFADTIPPQLVSASFTDYNSNGGVDSGDRITLTFSEPVEVQNGSMSALAIPAGTFLLPVSGDSLGTGATISDGTAGDAVLTITLGTTPALNPVGIYNLSSNTSNSASGIDIAATITAGFITDLATPPNDAIPSSIADVAAGSFSPDLTPPVITLVKLADTNLDNLVSSGDKMTLYFSETVRLQGGTASPVTIVAGDFNLPVTSDSFGTAGTATIQDVTAGDNALVITLGSSCKLTPAGWYTAGNTSSGSPSGIGIATPPANFIEDMSFYHNDIADTTVKDISAVYKSINTFYNASDMGYPRYAHTQTTLLNGTVLVTGGIRQDYSAVSTAELFHPTSVPGCGSWITAAGMAETRACHAATLLADGRVLLTGGRSAESGYAYVIRKSAEIFDPATGFFTSVADMPAGRFKHDAILLPDNRVMVLNGFEGTQWDQLYYSLHTYIFNPTAGTWQNGSDTVTVRLDHETVSLSGGAYAFLGGYGYDPAGGVTDSLLNSIEIYFAGAFTRQSCALPASIRYASSAVLDNGMAFVIGGYNLAANSTVDINRYIYTNPSVGNCVSADMLNTTRFYHESITLPNDKIITINGGYMDTGNTTFLIKRAELYTPSNGDVSVIGAMMAYGRLAFRVGYLPGADGVINTEDDIIFITGGRSTGNAPITKCEIYLP